MVRSLPELTSPHIILSHIPYIAQYRSPSYTVSAVLMSDFCADFFYECEQRTNNARTAHAHANSYEQRANYERELTRELRDAAVRFSVFAISIPWLRTRAGVVASSRLMRRDLYSICFSSALHTAARPGPRPRQRVWSAVDMGNRATFKAARPGPRP